MLMIDVPFAAELYLLVGDHPTIINTFVRGARHYHTREDALTKPGCGNIAELEFHLFMECAEILDQTYPQPEPEEAGWTFWQLAMIRSSGHDPGKTRAELRTDAAAWRAERDASGEG